MADNSSKVHASFDISNHKGGKGTNLYTVNQHRGEQGLLAFTGINIIEFIRSADVNLAYRVGSRLDFLLSPSLRMCRTNEVDII